MQPCRARKKSSLRTSVATKKFITETRKRSKAAYGDHVDCVKVLIVDDQNPSIIYSGSWDRTAKAWDTHKGVCLRTYYGPSHDIIDLAQTTTRSGLHLLFAVGGAPGVCCWRKENAQLIAVFNTEPFMRDEFIAYSVAATPATVFAGHAIEGILSWELDDAVLSSIEPSQPYASVWHPTEFEFIGSMPTSRGDVTFLSSAGAMCMRLSPDAGLHRQFLLSGHIYELSMLVANSWSDGVNRTLSGAVNCVNSVLNPLLNPHGMKGIELTKQYGAMVWDADSGVCAHVLAWQHTAPLRAVEFVEKLFLVTGDLQGLVVEWALADGSPVRRLQSAQANVRDMLVISDFESQALPELDKKTVLVTASSKGPHLVVHRLTTDRKSSMVGGAGSRSSAGAKLESTSESLAVAARSLQAEIAIEYNHTLDALRGLTTESGAFQFRNWSQFHADEALGKAGPAALDSTFSLCRIPRRGHTPAHWVTGHLNGQLLMWTDSGFVRALGSAARAQERGKPAAIPQELSDHALRANLAIAALTPTIGSKLHTSSQGGASVSAHGPQPSAPPGGLLSLTRRRQATLDDVRALTLNFEKWDADFNGQLTRAEFVFGLQAQALEHAQLRGAGTEGKPNGEGSGLVDDAQANALFDMFDTDRSGVIDLADAQKRLLKNRSSHRSSRAGGFPSLSRGRKLNFSWLPRTGFRRASSPSAGPPAQVTKSKSFITFERRSTIGMAPARKFVTLGYARLTAMTNNLPKVMTRSKSV